MIDLLNPDRRTRLDYKTEITSLPAARCPLPTSMLEVGGRSSDLPFCAVGGRTELLCSVPYLGNGWPGGRRRAMPRGPSSNARPPWLKGRGPLSSLDSTTQPTDTAALFVPCIVSVSTRGLTWQCANGLLLRHNAQPGTVIPLSYCRAFAFHVSSSPHVSNGRLCLYSIIRTDDCQ
ncbi:hypothetical protein MPTK1_1g12180 [Marchantia polymorpha subsp. ruderalis]|uniref:Uncharacterized protein n=2 Tax=Marchantia polymorpha TaxID=3197 RepID=A0AAF6APA5_MARPO|nr:hypothetical protein MARPO_0014s0015 [Marchantia polymorpha]BBM98275.1 hypothetical protein Mp_1g12180 [Marchantia polymorpha subsp. ruderalis]|eukprot:PTQ45450.1 hypothetical protein MARPO_0014s0015 [Marchantia polymorpha]